MKKKEKPPRLKAQIRQLEDRIQSLESFIRDLGQTEPAESGQSDADQSGAFPKFFKRGLKQRYLTRVQKVLDQPDFDYFLFEHANRESDAKLQARLTQIVELFLGKGNVLDVGCGRGDFLQVMKEKFIPAYGIDTNRDSVAECQERGLEAMEADAFDHLPTVPRASLGGIFLGRVLEHLSANKAMKLAESCCRALKPGGVLVVNSINPQCLTALGAFWKDPTRLLPMHRDLTQFILEQAGFVDVRVLDSQLLTEDDRLAVIPVQPEDSAEMRALKESLNRNLEQLNRTLYDGYDYTLVGTVPEALSLETPADTIPDGK